MDIKTLVSTCLLLALTHGSSLAAGDQPEMPDRVERLLIDLGFNDNDARELLAGKIISKDLQDGSNKELAVTVAMLISRPLQEVYNTARQGNMLEVARDFTKAVELQDGPFNDGAFEGAAYIPEEGIEISRLARASAGSKMNLSPDEIERFAAIGRRLGTRGAATDRAVREAVNAETRRLLMNRYRAYRDGGVDAIAPYDREPGQDANPSQELAGAASRSLLADRAPDFYRTFVDYPQNQDDSIEHRFYWIKQRLDKRPTFILAHRMFQLRPAYAVMAERQFFAGHTYNSRQIIVGFLPVEEGTVVFYTDRTSTDRVDLDSVHDILHELGRRQLRERIVKQFHTIRLAMQQTDPEP